MEVILTIVLAVIGSSGLSSVIVACLTRKWNKEDKLNQKEDKQDERIDALVESNKLLMLDKIKDSAKVYIERGCITLDEKEHFMEEYKVYKKLGGNGHADLPVQEVNKLVVVSEGCE